MNGPLHGIRIIDQSNMLMAPYATQILGDMGADVIKVESPEGDPVRGIGPMRNPGMGAIYLNANRSKRSVVIDLKHPDGRSTLLDMVRTADVFLSNLRPRSLDGLGLGWTDLSAVNPRLVYASLFGFAQDGPYADYPAFDDLIQGAVGLPWLSHRADGGPARYAPTAIVDRGVALWAVGQINAALFARERGAGGQHIQIPMFEMMASLVLADHLAGETFSPSMGEPGYVRMLNPHRRPFKTLDGYLCVMIYTDRHWASFFKTLGEEAQFKADDRYRSMTTRTQHIEAIYGELSERLLKRTTAQWMELMREADVPAIPMHTLSSLIDDPHLAETGFLQTFEHPSEGRLRTIAYPTCWTQTQPGATRPAPQLGEHTHEVLTEMGYSSDRIATLEQSQAIRCLKSA